MKELPPGQSSAGFGETGDLGPGAAALEEFRQARMVDESNLAEKGGDVKI